MFFELIILAGGIVGIFGGILGWELPLLRSSIAGLMIIYGLSCYPYPKEDRHKISLAIGCIVFVLSGIAAFLIASWWVLPIGVAAGFGVTLCIEIMADRSSTHEDIEVESWCHENGIKGFEAHYKNGEYHGTVTYWHENGQKFEEMHYKNGNFHGSKKAWYENGQQQIEEHFKNGDSIGTSISWYKNGKKEMETRYKKGDEHGIENCWYSNGQISKKSRYKNGRLISVTSWKPDGTRCSITRIVGGCGVVVHYKENGEKKKKIHYENGSHRKTTTYRQYGIALEDL